MFAHGCDTTVKIGEQPLWNTQPVDNKETAITLRQTGRHLQIMMIRLTNRLLASLWVRLHQWLLVIDSSIILPVNIHHAAKRHCWGICFVLTLNASSYCSFFSMQLATDLHFFTCLWQLIAVLVHIATSEVMPFNLILKTEAAWLHLSPILSSRSTNVAVKTWSLTSLYQQSCAAHEQG